MERLILGLVMTLALTGGALAGEAPLYHTKDCSQETGQMGLNQCTGANLDAANVALNMLYRKLMAHQTDPKAKEQLKNTERAWVAAKDKECNNEASADAGGSIQTMDYNECEIDKTDARIRELEKMSGCAGSVSACNLK